MATVHSFTTGEGEPDFTVRSGPDPDVEFHVQRSALIAGSDVFKDMFSVCTVPDSSWVDISETNSVNRVDAETSMEMPESADVLQMLFRVLHEAPIVLPSAKQMAKWERLPEYMKDSDKAPPIDKGNAIPLPLLKRLFVLADKYQLPPNLVSTLHSHLVAHAFDEPLQVYALATRLEANDVAAFASTQLHSPPLESYSPEELEILPSIQSLHVLYVLHAHRKVRLQEILSEESLFPHGYRLCKKHSDKADEAWRTQKRFLLSMGRIHAGTDLATEMSPVLLQLQACETCTKAFNAAIGMLQYKGQKVPRSISKLPRDSNPSPTTNGAPN